MKVHSVHIFLLGLVLVSVPSNCQQKIAGGSLATISSYPFVAALLHTSNSVSFVQKCAGSILNTRSILTTAHCVAGEPPSRWRMRLGSSYANSGGVVYNVSQFIIHDNYNGPAYVNDVAIIRSTNTITFNNNIRVASIAGANNYLADNQPVWAIGWGGTYFGGSLSEQLRHVLIWTVNQSVCQTRYASLGYQVTENMVCAGGLDVGGRDQCRNDGGGPLLHNDVVVGIVSWGYDCGMGPYPGVSTRVSKFTPWIQANA